MSERSLIFAVAEAEASQVSYDQWIDLVAGFRAQRDSIYGADLFNDPAWDIILFLGRDANVDGASLQSISDAIAVSQATTSRWLRVLIERQHVEQSDEGRFRLLDDARVGLMKIVF